MNLVIVKLYYIPKQKNDLLSIRRLQKRFLNFDQQMDLQDNLSKEGFDYSYQHEF